VRITHVNKYFFPPHLGGVEQSLNLLTVNLAAAGHDVSAIVSNEASRTVREDVAGVDVLRLARTIAFSSTPIAPGMPGALRDATTGDAAADVLHFHFPYPWGDWSWLRSGARGPAVVTYHSDIVRQKRMLAAYAPVLRRFLERVDRIIVGAPQIAENSPFVSAHLDKVRVVPFAIDTNRLVDDAAADARVAVVRQGRTRPLILFVGRLVYYKGVSVLVDAMEHVDADLVIIGRGPLEGELREKAVALGIADRLTFLTPVDDAELAAWYRAASVFCLPSTEPSEAYGLVQLEAHACGTPVVSTDLPTGVPFVNLDGVTGFIVPVGDARALASALTKLTTDRELRDQLGRQARDRVSWEFSVPTMVERTLAVYAEAIESHAQRAGRG
jgi:glycosyltransferase involved in cell wall biosynthesis